MGWGWGCEQQTPDARMARRRSVRQAGRQTGRRAGGGPGGRQGGRCSGGRPRTISAVRLCAIAFSHSRLSPSSRYWSEACVRAWRVGPQGTVQGQAKEGARGVSHVHKDHGCDRVHNHVHKGHGCDRAWPSSGGWMQGHPSSEVITKTLVPACMRACMHAKGRVQGPPGGHAGPARRK